MVGSSGWQQRVSASQLAGFTVRLPDPTSLSAFGEAASAAFAHMKSLDAESKNLAQLRDTLLPKLMSGELRVRDAEKASEVTLVAPRRQAERFQGQSAATWRRYGVG